MNTNDVVRYVIDSFEGKLYTDDPVDTGGATKFGITQRTLQYYRRKVTGDPTLVVTKADVRNLQIEEAVACGVEVFAVEPRIAEIGDWRMRLLVYDYGFHSGQPRAVRALQEALGVAVDGALGPATLAACAHATEVPNDDGLLVALKVLTSREEFMQDIMERRQTQRRFMLGWWKRTTKLQRLVLQEP